MLRCNELGGECCLMLLTPGRRFLRYRPPTVCSFVVEDQPSPRCEWSELIKPHRIIVSESFPIHLESTMRVSPCLLSSSTSPPLGVLPLLFSLSLFSSKGLRFVLACYLGGNAEAGGRGG